MHQNVCVMHVCMFGSMYGGVWMDACMCDMCMYVCMYACSMYVCGMYHSTVIACESEGERMCVCTQKSTGHLEACYVCQYTCIYIVCVYPYMRAGTQKTQSLCLYIHDCMSPMCVAGCCNC